MDKVTIRRDNRIGKFVVRIRCFGRIMSQVYTDTFTEATELSQTLVKSLSFRQKRNMMMLRTSAGKVKAKVRHMYESV